MTTACQDVRHRAIRWLFHAPYQPQPMHLNEPWNGQPESQAQPLSQLPHQKREQRGGSAPLLAYRPVCIQAHPGQARLPSLESGENLVPGNGQPEGVDT